MNICFSFENNTITNNFSMYLLYYLLTLEEENKERKEY